MPIELNSFKQIFPEFPGHKIENRNVAEISLLENKKQWEVTVTGPSDYGVSYRDDLRYEDAKNLFNSLIEKRTIAKKNLRYFKES